MPVHDHSALGPQDSADAPHAEPLAQIESLTHRLREDLHRLGAVSGERTPYGADFGSLVDAAQLSGDQDRDAMLRQQLERRIEQLNWIKQRLAQGHYGRCDVCGDAIPAERLLAKPDTMLCVACQRARERRPWRRVA